MYPHPFSVGYWRTAAGELKDVRKLTFAALCMALLHGTVRHSVGAPVGRCQDHMGLPGQSGVRLGLRTCTGLVFAVAEDLLSFFITGGGGYPSFPAIL